MMSISYHINKQNVLKMSRQLSVNSSKKNQSCVFNYILHNRVVWLTIMGCVKEHSQSVYTVYIFTALKEALILHTTKVSEGPPGYGLPLYLVLLSH